MWNIILGWFILLNICPIIFGIKVYLEGEKFWEAYFFTWVMELITAVIIILIFIAFDLILSKDVILRYL